MNIYEISDPGVLLSENPYPGRGIVIGKTADGTKAAIAYFIMGRSENSRNRVFKQLENGDVYTAPFDESKVEDPSLIIYNAVRSLDNKLIVTNGDQTDTIYNYVAEDAAFQDALDTREFEPDRPNWTPRISGMLTFAHGDFTYQMGILKSADEAGSACNRFYYQYNKALPGLGHFLHTYQCDGSPIPTFQGEPERVSIPNDLNQFAQEIWNGLNQANKVSLYVRFTDLATGKAEDLLVNKNK